MNMIGHRLTPPTQYRSKSTGKVTPIREMVSEHLDNAISKLSRSKLNPPLLDALKSERDRRNNG